MPRITAGSVLSGLSAPIIVTSISSFCCRHQLPPHEQESTDDTVRGHATGGELL